MEKKIKVGIVGARGKCMIMGLQNCENVEITAICDLDEDVLKEISETYNIPNTYRIYDDMLESDIDAVIVATPMQYHVMQTLAALEAGKHVMSEVTAGVTMDELHWLVEAVEKSGKTYMMAENYCYSPQAQMIRSMSEAGLFGKLYYAEGEYLHDIKDLAVYKNGKTSWRSYWQLGTRGCFYPTHSLGPVMKCFPAGKRITSVSSFGTGSFTAPQFKQDDTTVTMCTLDGGELVKVRVDCLSNRPHKMNYYLLQGTNGAYEAPRGLGDDHKVHIMPEGAEYGYKQEWQPLKEYEGLYLPERYKTATEEQKKTGHEGGDFFIVKDFIDAVANGTKPYVDVYDAAEWSAVGLLSNISVQNGGKAMDMPNFRKNQKV
ncbi:MAG: Gfo/Idh/MocA family oxidoreductase [Ruminococcaceae bacterium]|nr:Gfo/Idh/MocA family oxidoreductase [Oscillospiraceae bacterium]